MNPKLNWRIISMDYSTQLSNALKETMGKALARWEEIKDDVVYDSMEYWTEMGILIASWKEYHKIADKIWRRWDDEIEKDFQEAERLLEDIKNEKSLD